MRLCAASAHLTSLHNETIRSWTDIVERITGDQRKLRVPARPQHTYVIRWDDFDGRHLILIRAVQCLKLDHVILAYSGKPAK